MSIHYHSSGHPLWALCLVVVEWPRSVDKLISTSTNPRTFFSFQVTCKPGFGGSNCGKVAPTTTTTTSEHYFKFDITNRFHTRSKFFRGTQAVHAGRCVSQSRRHRVGTLHGQVSLVSARHVPVPGTYPRGGGGSLGLQARAPLGPKFSLWEDPIIPISPHFVRVPLCKF